MSKQLDEKLQNKSKKDRELWALRHTAEHVLHAAMQNLYPKLKKAMGPATENGFYHDFDYEEKIAESNFPVIEKEMQRIIDANLPLVQKFVTVEEAKKLFKDNPYKLEWLEAIKKRGEKVSIYSMGEMDVDLCSGPHVKSTGEIKAFTLLSVAGAYWRGSEKNKMLTRIYGTAFFSQKNLDAFLNQKKEAETRDHRKIGQELQLFMIDEEVGQGLIIWLPKGAILRHTIMEFAFNTYLSCGYQPVSTPHIASEALWSHSGHLNFYKESMYNSFGIENEKYRLKPMNCPMHVKIYNHTNRSYRDLPMRLTEMGTVYRYEKSGVLHGLTRVRGFTQDDAHIICTPDQLKNELADAMNLTLYILKTFGFSDFEMSLSVRDPHQKKKYAGTEEGWNKAENALKDTLASAGFTSYTLDVGGAVFYGPKIDLKIADSIGRKWQLSTIQVDFNLPGKFYMGYVDQSGKIQQPFMIHRALLGSLERFIGVYIEHTAGNFPTWLTPVQVKVLPIADRHLDYAKTVTEKLRNARIRTELDDRKETLQAKIRNAQMEKVAYMLIIGDQEVDSHTVTERGRSGKNYGKVSIDEFIIHISKEIDEKTII